LEKAKEANSKQRKRPLTVEKGFGEGNSGLK